MNVLDCQMCYNAIVLRIRTNRFDVKIKTYYPYSRSPVRRGPGASRCLEESLAHAESQAIKSE